MSSEPIASVQVDTDQGYAHPAYAASLQEFGTPCRLPKSGGSMLIRSIPDTDHADAMGPYPLFVCGDWEQIGNDLETHKDDWVSATVVVDPFGAPKELLTQQEFDEVRSFKTHWLVDLAEPYEDSVSSHHRYYARYAHRNGVKTYRVAEPHAKLDEWCRLYGHLVERHNITGLQAFSRQSFEHQFDIPGLVVFFAEYEGEPVGAHLWYEMGDVAYSHLSACNDVGYDERASYALHQAAITHFRSHVQWLNLGGGAGAPSDDTDGLTKFKKGWASTSQPSLLCGRVLQPSVYNFLATTGTDYFPAYRAGELL